MNAEAITKPPWHDAWMSEGPKYEAMAIQAATASECSIRQELVFCLLGGHGVQYELALSATDVVMALCPFESFWTDEPLALALAEELSEPQFDPRRKDGSFRRYRYPNRKAQLLVQARDWVLTGGPLVERLNAIPCERERRDWLCDCPGVGPKSASWLLRNTGFASRLAILDVHILRAMEAANRLEPSAWPADYDDVERHFVAWCDELNAPVSALDLFLWEWQRGTPLDHEMS
jgi:N-glycosylase/DNA lyase